MQQSGKGRTPRFLRNPLCQLAPAGTGTSPNPLRPGPLPFRHDLRRRWQRRTNVWRRRTNLTTGSERLRDMPVYEEYQIVINGAQRRLIMRALTNAMANDRRSTGAMPLLVRRKMNGCSLFGCSARSNRLCENGCPDFSLLLLLDADEQIFGVNEQILGQDQSD